MDYARMRAAEEAKAMEQMKAVAERNYAAMAGMDDSPVPAAEMMLVAQAARLTNVARDIESILEGIRGSVIGFPPPTPGEKLLNPVAMPCLRETVQELDMLLNRCRINAEDLKRELG